LEELDVEQRTDGRAPAASTLLLAAKSFEAGELEIEAAAVME
jgi:hypothetical protein